MKGVLRNEKEYVYDRICICSYWYHIFTMCYFTDTKFNGIFWGFAGAGIIPGLIMIFKYLYWTQPKNEARYKTKIEEEEINLHDERKELFRNQSGRYAYILGLITVCFSIIVLSLLYYFDVIQNAKLLIIYLGLYAVFQYISGILIFKYLNKKY